MNTAAGEMGGAGAREQQPRPLPAVTPGSQTQTQTSGTRGGHGGDVQGTQKGPESHVVSCTRARHTRLDGKRSASVSLPHNPCGILSSLFF